MHVAGQTEEGDDRSVPEGVSRIYSERGGRADYLASIVGALASLGTLVIVAALIAAVTLMADYQPTRIDPVGAPIESFVAVLTGIALLAFAVLLVGGFAAGRMARFSGGLNGLGVGLWMLLLMVFLAFGAWIADAVNMLDKLLDRVVAPAWVAEIDVGGVLTSPRMVIATAVLAVTLILGGYVGGRLGERHHRRMDAAIVG